MGRRLATLVSFLPVVLSVTPGCTTQNRLLAPDGRPLEQVPPATYRIAVLPVAQSAAVTAPEDGLHFTIEPAALQQRLVDDLNELRAASATFASADAEAAVAAGADLILVPRLVSARLEHESVADTWWASGLLWITTWIGGLFVPDSSYEARIEFEFDVRNAAELEQAFSLTAASGSTDLSFFDRNEVFTGGFFLSLILPPFWTTDDTEITSASLSEQAVRSVSGRIVNFLKFELGEREKDSSGQVEFESPENGAVVGETVVVAGTVHGRQPVDAIVVTVNGEPVPLATQVRRFVDQRRDASGGRYKEPFRTGPIPLRPGDNEIGVRITLLDRRDRPFDSSRTLRVHRGAAGPERRGQDQ